MKKISIKPINPNNIGNIQHEKEVHALVNSLMEKLGISCSIEDLVKIYEIEDLDSFLKSNNDLVVNTKTHSHIIHKIYPWSDVVASMYTMPECVTIIETICPECGEKLVELYFSSPKRTWASLCGRAGLMTICPNCPQQVDFKCRIMN